MSGSPRQPTFFLPHGGGPCFFMDWTWGPADTWNATKHFLECVAASLPEPPKALLVVSGHWEEPAFTASAIPEPQLIFDYSGFPEHTYRLTWPAPGSPEMAAQAAELLTHAGLPAALSPTRGFDHGVFVPLKVAFPAAQIPTVTLSLASSLDPALHLAAGRALAPLRDESLIRWQDAPYGRFAHPREEHLIPLMVAAGAGGEAPGKRIFTDEPMNAAISAYRFD